MMHPTIIFGETSDSLLGSILGHSLIEGIGATIIAQDVPEQKLELEVVEQQADVVVLEFKQTDLPGICNRILHIAPQTVIVGLSSTLTDNECDRNVRIMVLTSGETDPHQIVDTVITALQKSLHAHYQVMTQTLI